MFVVGSAVTFRMFNGDADSSIARFNYDEADESFNASGGGLSCLVALMVLDFARVISLTWLGLSRSGPGPAVLANGACCGDAQGGG